MLYVGPKSFLRRFHLPAHLAQPGITNPSGRSICLTQTLPALLGLSAPSINYTLFISMLPTIPSMFKLSDNSLRTTCWEDVAKQGSQSLVPDTFK